MEPYVKKVLAATAGTRFGAMIRCAYGVERDAQPRFIGRASITSDGFLMWSFVTASGEHKSGAFAGDAESYFANVVGLIRHLNLTADDRAEFSCKMQEAIGADWRPKASAWNR